MWQDYSTLLLDTEGFYERGLDVANVYNQLTLTLWKIWKHLILGHVRLLQPHGQ